VFVVEGCVEKRRASFFSREETILNPRSGGYGLPSSTLPGLAWARNCRNERYLLGKSGRCQVILSGDSSPTYLPRFFWVWRGIHKRVTSQCKAFRAWCQFLTMKWSNRIAQGPKAGVFPNWVTLCVRKWVTPLFLCCRKVFPNWVTLLAGGSAEFFEFRPWNEIRKIPHHAGYPAANRPDKPRRPAGRRA
jgi:hypothetical protein